MYITKLFIVTIIILLKRKIGQQQIKEYAKR